MLCLFEVNQKGTKTFSMGVALVPLLSNLKRYSPQFATALLTVYIQKISAENEWLYEQGSENRHSSYT